MGFDSSEVRDLHISCGCWVSIFSVMDRLFALGVGGKRTRRHPWFIGALLGRVECAFVMSAAPCGTNCRKYSNRVQMNNVRGCFCSVLQDLNKILC